jgi:spore maturation protein CgeB
MNILLIGKFNVDDFAQHISETFTKLGHNVLNYEAGPKVYQTNSVAVKRSIKIINSIYSSAIKIPFISNLDIRSLKKLLNKNKIDLTISVHDFLTPEHVKTIKHITKAPTVLWHPDGLHNFGKAMFLNADYDYLFFKDPYVVEYFRNTLIKNSYYLPECCNPDYHKPVNINAEETSFYGCELTTAGGIYTNREAFFRNLKNYNVKIWGSSPPLWMNTSHIKKMIMNKYVVHEQKAKAFTAAKIVLNNLNPGEIWGINCRAFEVTACGGFEMINYRKGLSQLFEIDKEVVSFNNYNDLIEKIDYYLSHDNERAMIAEAGRLRAHKDHTYKLRLQLMLKTVFENEKGYDMPEII